MLIRTTFVLGIALIVPLSDLDSSAWLGKDIRMAVYHNERSAIIEAGTTSESFASFLASAGTNPSILRASESAAVIAREIGKKLLSLLLKGGEEVDISKSLTELGMDSMVAVEIRAWWRKTFSFDTSVLEMLSMGTLEALGECATEGLTAMYEA